MGNEAKLLVGIIALLILANGFIYFSLFDTGKGEVQTRLIQEDSQSPEEKRSKDEQLRKKGWDALIDGEVVSIDKKQIIVRAFSKAKNDFAEYVILLDEKNTKYFQQKMTMVLDGEGQEVPESSGEAENVNIENVQQGSRITVKFPQRVDVDGADKLIASEIILEPKIK